MLNQINKIWAPNMGLFFKEPNYLQAILAVRVNTLFTALFKALANPSPTKCP